MYETIIQEKPRTFKEIDNRHTMICIEDVEAVKIGGFNNRERVDFYINDTIYSSKEFATKEEALKFRNEIMGWEEK